MTFDVNRGIADRVTDKQGVMTTVAVRELLSDSQFQELANMAELSRGFAGGPASSISQIVSRPDADLSTFGGSGFAFPDARALPAGSMARATEIIERLSSPGISPVDRAILSESLEAERAKLFKLSSEYVDASLGGEPQEAPGRAGEGLTYQEQGVSLPAEAAEAAPPPPPAEAYPAPQVDGVLTLQIFAILSSNPDNVAELLQASIPASAIAGDENYLLLTVPVGQDLEAALANLANPASKAWALVEEPKEVAVVLPEKGYTRTVSRGSIVGMPPKAGSRTFLLQ